MNKANRLTHLIPGRLLAAFMPLVIGGLQTAQAGESAELALAKAIVLSTGVKGGLVVHVGGGNGKLTAALRVNDGYLVHGLDADAKNVQKARKHIQSLGLYGNVSVERWDADTLPYTDNLVNLLVSENLGNIPMAEVMRVLCPRGVAYINKGEKWAKTIKPRPKEIDEWTHYLHDASNNAVAHDSVVGPPRHLQWVGSPRWTRHHDHMSSVSGVVSAGGRVFYIFDEGSTVSIQLPSKWSLIARDAFNGTILWKRPIKTWHTRFWPLKSGPAHLPRRLVAVGERVYVTLGLHAPLTALDAATGKTLRTYKGTAATDEVIAADGVLFLLVDEARVGAKPDDASAEKIKRRGRDATSSETTRQIMAVQADSGKILWHKGGRVLPLTLAADRQRVFFHDGEKTVCLDRKSGDELWTSEPVPRWKTIRSYFAPTLVVHQDVVLFAGGESMVHDRGGTDTMTALSAQTGKVLWTSEHPPSGYRSPEDLLVVGGLVWSGATTREPLSGVFTGRDLHTGEVKSEFAPDVDTYWFHHRCHRGKATDRYLLMSRTGIEFVDFRSKQWITHHWVRGACLYGIMPCNGLIYAPPHPCACYPEAKLNGFNALAPARTSKVEGQMSDDDRLEHGPAYTEIANRKSKIQNSQDWPTYRHDAARSGFTRTTVPAILKPAWQTDLGGRLSTVVIAEGKVFVAQIDAHTVHALGAKDGRRVWSYTVGGRVDSPPTIHDGCVLFGSADGWVYCLRASDGALAWRFRAAPTDRRLTAFEQLESVWPVHGSVLVQDGVVTCVAGRSMFLDGGLHLLRLDPKTGRKLSETILDHRDPETGENLQTRIKVLNMPVALPDVLSSDGRYVYMRSQMFDLQGKRLELGPHSGDPEKQGSTQRGEGVHLFCPTGFLDGTWFHRSYWVYGRSFAGGHNGYHQAGKFAPAGRILVFDDASVYGYGRKAKYYRWTTPLEHQLFATSNQIPHVEMPAKPKAGSRIKVEKSKSLNPTNTPLTVETWVKAEKPDGAILARGGSSHGYALIIKGGKPRFVIRTDKQITSVGAKKKIRGKWAHVAGVLTADKKLAIYVNGEPAGSAEAPGLIASDPSDAMEIGADEGSSVGNYKRSFGFTGIIDEVKIYRRALSAGEIHEHYSTKSQAATEDADLVLHYSFDKDDATDDSGNRNDGTVEGAKPIKGKFGDAMKFTSKKRAWAQSVIKYHWSCDTPLYVRAMVLADKTLFIAGPPDVVDEEKVFRLSDDAKLRATLGEQSAALAGRQDALLWAVSTADGKKLAEYKLDSPPIFDGMAAAAGRLYIASQDGRLICMGK